MLVTNKEKRDHRVFLFISVLCLSFLLHFSARGVSEILHNEVTISPLLNSQWVTIGDFHTQDDFFLGYVATQWTFFGIMSLLSIGLVFLIKHEESSLKAVVALFVIAVSGLSGFIL